ncbi:hypothetical protein GGR52DRAFT_21482 [Hypoxylon sp. FL1284]|nr:hypothetical protein GGR52DRAFT_21482 [Hypoxylon sp. FL1284]
MSSPAASNDGEASKSTLEQITFRFCSECSNMLYPKEDEDAHKLQFTCRTCQYTEEATSSCVFRNVMNSAAGETAGVTQDVGSDPTVRIPSTSSPQSPAHACADDGLAICLRCGMTLLHCDRCKDPASVSEFIDFVAHNTDFAISKTFAALQLANYWNVQDDKEKDDSVQRFASFDELTTSSPSESSLADYLHINISFMDSDADPPEALEDPDGDTSTPSGPFAI